MRDCNKGRFGKMSKRIAVFSAVLCVAGVLAGQAFAQAPQFHNQSAGGSNNVFPFGSTSTMKVEQHYLPSMFTGAYNGMITKVYWRMNTASSATSYTNLKIWLAQTPSATFASTTNLWTPVTQVYNSNVTVPAGAANDWFGFQLSTPFPYDPNQSLIVIVCHEGYSGGGIQLRTASLAVPPYRRIWAPACASTSGTNTDGNSYDFGFDLSSAYFNDAGISALLSPVNFCSGTYDIIVNLKNYGKNNLNSAVVKWEYDGVPQTDINFVGPLTQFGDASITLGQRNFAAGIGHTLKVWTRLPNGVAVDSGYFNDTLSATLKPALSGTFTVGGASPDYANLAAAAADLMKIGVCGPVTFKVRAGTYNWQMDLGTVPGTSMFNTITFESESGNNDVFINYNATTTADNFVIRFNGCDWVTFQNMTLTAQGATYGTVFGIQGGSEHCTINNVTMNGIPTTTSTSTNLAVIYSPSGSMDHYTTIRNCRILNGSMGMYWYGSGTAALEMGTVFENNTCTGFSYYGFLMYYQDAPIVTGNTLRTDAHYSTLYVLNLMYCQNRMQAVGNTIIANGTGTVYGVRLYYCTATNGAEGLFANNFITINNLGSTAYGLYDYYSNYQKVYFNSVYINTTSTSYAVYTYYGSARSYSNNIFYFNGPGYAWYCAPGTNVIASDYNVLYTNGTNLAYWNTTCPTIANLRTANGKDANSISKGVNFANTNDGNLHLTGASEDDDDLIGLLMPEVYDDIDREPRVEPFRGADEACYITNGSVTYQMVDAGGIPTPYANMPGTIGIHYNVSFPDFDANITMTVNFYSIPGNVLMHTAQITASKAYGAPLDGTQYITIPTIPAGYYRVEVVFNTKNSCGSYRNYMPYPSAFMLLPQGQTPCLVWPGDVNNDGVLNFGDRKSLNSYIHDANMSPVWLSGPTRYRADAAQNPLTYYTWEAQAAVPWATPEGCYMDADGNGMVNNFDFIVMKVNWMKTHGTGTPKSDAAQTASVFDLRQNFPNPFNPSTQIQYSCPEPSYVRLIVVDVSGKEIATLVEGNIDAGIHSVQFDGGSLSSGKYIAIVRMTGKETGVVFDKSMTMILSK